MAYREVFTRFTSFFNDEVYPNPSSVILGLDKNDLDLASIHRKFERQFALDSTGNFTDTNGVSQGLLTLWCNAGGVTGSKYYAKIPDGDETIDFTFVLNYGDGSPISLMQLFIDNLTAQPSSGLRAMVLDPTSPLTVFKEWFGSQAQYNAIVSPSADTQYIIVG